MTSKASRRKLVLFRISGVVISLVISLVIAEVALRILGFKPWSNDVRANDPRLLEFHPTYGWQSKEGSYAYSVLPGGPPIHVTVLPDGIRSSGPDQGPSLSDKPNIVVLGCSWMFGWAISDRETLAWKLQEAFPGWRVVNYGTAGYGTYQSFLRLEDALPGLHPDVIVYGFIPVHEDRNVGGMFWLRGLAQRSHRGHVTAPYVTLSQGRLDRHGLTRYSAWPGHSVSALIAALEKSWADYAASKRTRQGRQATQQLLLEMKRLADQCHAKLLVAFLANDPSIPDLLASYREFADANQIAFVDCSQSVIDDAERVPGDGHPNQLANSRWFKIIEPAIRGLLKQKSETLP